MKRSETIRGTRSTARRRSPLFAVALVSASLSVASPFAAVPVAAVPVADRIDDAGDRTSAGDAAVDAAPGDLVILTWGGAYEASQRAAYFEPFTRRTGIGIRVARYDGGVEILRPRVPGESPAWDVVDLEAADARAACREGLLEPFDASLLVDVDGVPARDDFDRGAIGGCSIAQLVFSTVVAYDTRAFPAEKPRRIGDFFDLERFPAERGLRCAPVALLEWAPLAYDVPCSQVYDLLSTRRGLDLAFRKLDGLRGNIVWWRGGDEPIDLLGAGEMVMSSGCNGRFFDAQANAGAPVSVIWDGQLVDHSTWAIPRGAAALDAAKAFISFATRPDRMADQAMRISYGPTRESARRRVGRQVDLGVDMNDYLPTSGDRMRRAVIRDSDWYARTEALSRRRFAEWLRTSGVGPCPGASG